jgi:hypothetical protein
VWCWTADVPGVIGDSVAAESVYAERAPRRDRRRRGESI